MRTLTHHIVRNVVLALPLAILSFAAQATALSDAFENTLVDGLFRGQTLTPRATYYVALYTTACSDTGPGTEVSGGNYARVAVSSSLANWSGTQNSTATTASTGTSGTTYNINPITFNSPSANWGQVQSAGLTSASSGGTMDVCVPLSQAKTINNGDPAPSFAAGALSVQVDN